MKFLSSLAASFFAATIFTGSLATITNAASGDPVTMIDTFDLSMNAAISQAKQTFPLFMVNYYASQTNADNSSVKVGLATIDDGVEHIWVGPFWETDTGFAGFLANEPNFLGDLSLGSEVAFTEDLISDWSFHADGKTYGNYTTRALLPHLPEESVISLKEYLSEMPIPAGW